MASKSSGNWSVANAKARLSEVMDRAKHSPQTITRNGRPAVVVVSFEQWQSKSARRGSLADFLLNSPLAGSGLTFDRIEAEPRDPDL